MKTIDIVVVTIYYNIAYLKIKRKDLICVLEVDAMISEIDDAEVRQKLNEVKYAVCDTKEGFYSGLYVGDTIYEYIRKKTNRRICEKGIRISLIKRVRVIDRILNNFSDKKWKDLKDRNEKNMINHKLDSTAYIGSYFSSRIMEELEKLKSPKRKKNLFFGFKQGFLNSIHYDSLFKEIYKK